MKCFTFTGDPKWSYGTLVWQKAARVLRFHINMCRRTICMNNKDEVERISAIKAGKKSSQAGSKMLQKPMKLQRCDRIFTPLLTKSSSWMLGNMQALLTHLEMHKFLWLCVCAWTAVTTGFQDTMQALLHKSNRCRRSPPLCPRHSTGSGCRMCSALQKASGI